MGNPLTVMMALVVTTNYTFTMNSPGWLPSWLYLYSFICLSAGLVE